MAANTGVSRCMYTVLASCVDTYSLPELLAVGDGGSGGSCSDAGETGTCAGAPSLV